MKISSKRVQRQHFSPLRYPGGKTFLHPLFADSIRKLRHGPVTYVEPYAGGAGAALALLYLEIVERIVINDLHPAIYSFWRSILVESERFVEKLHSISVNVSEWKRQREIYRDRRSKRFDLGFATFYLNRTNVSGILDGGVIGGIEQKGRWKIDARFNKQTLSERIEQFSLYRDRITVTCLDGQEVTRRFLKDRNAFIYLDPPYYEKGATLYSIHYANDDHVRLARCLNRNPKANWMLTYDNKNEIIDLYPDRRRRTFSLFHTARESKKSKELLIVSDTFCEIL